MEKLFNYQYDFIKLKLYGVDTDKINWKALKPHNNLTSHYTIISEGEFFDNNFDLFIDGGNNITIRTSMPYLVYGHNFKPFDQRAFSYAIDGLSDLLGVDLSHTTILELEFGAYCKIDVPAKNYIKNLIGLENYTIEKATPSMRMYGNTKDFHFKVYDPIENAKAKKTFSISQYPDSPLIKYEVKKSSKMDFKADDLCNEDVFDEFKTLLNYNLENLIVKNESPYLPVEPSINHILFATLKNMEQEFHVPVYAEIISGLDNMNLSASQKSKRKKTLLELETTYNAQQQKR